MTTKALKRFPLSEFTTRHLTTLFPQPDNCLCPWLLCIGSYSELIAQHSALLKGFDGDKYTRPAPTGSHSHRLRAGAGRPCGNSLLSRRVNRSTERISLLRIARRDRVSEVGRLARPTRVVPRETSALSSLTQLGGESVFCCWGKTRNQPCWINSNRFTRRRRMSWSM